LPELSSGAMIVLRQVFTTPWNEAHLCNVPLLRKRDVQRAGQITELNTAELARSNGSHCETDRIRCFYRRQLMTELFPQVTKHLGFSIAPIPVDGAGGSALV
jgi:hypothetical protein